MIDILHARIEALQDGIRTDSNWKPSKLAPAIEDLLVLIVHCQCYAAAASLRYLRAARVEAQTEVQQRAIAIIADALRLRYTQPLTGEQEAMMASCRRAEANISALIRQPSGLIGPPDPLPPTMRVFPPRIPRRLRYISPSESSASVSGDSSIASQAVKRVR